MKILKVLAIAASVCLLAVFVSGSAYTQQDDDELQQIIDQFCEDVLQIAQGARDELTEAINDKLNCVEEFHQCRTGEGFGRADTLADCLNDGNRCTSRANDDLADACREFSLEFKDSYGDANRRARRNDVEDGFVDWLNTPSPERRACLRPAIRVSKVCAGLADE